MEAVRKMGRGDVKDGMCGGEISRVHECPSNPECVYVTKQSLKNVCHVFWPLGIPCLAVLSVDLI
jgi:hypothetical protein